MKLPYAVIFDADGVLVDSYQAHFESWQRLAAESGGAMTEQQFVATFGCTSREVIPRDWSADQLTDERIRELDDRKEHLFREIIVGAFPTMPSARDLIADLQTARFALAIGTSGPPENLALALKHLDGPSWCQASISAADVTRGKPHPEVFLLAAARLGVPPDRCAVVEDSPPGIAAARAAGMVSIALVSRGHKHADLAAADHLVDRLDELSAARIAKWIDHRSG